MKAAALGVAGALVLALLAGVFLLGAGTTTTTSSSGPGTAQAIPDPPADGSAGVIVGKHSSGGLTIFGLRLQGEEHFVHVMFTPPAECVTTADNGVETVRDDGPCADLPATGEASGGGTGANGQKLVIITVEVDGACYEATVEASSWPSSSEACLDDGD